MVFERNCTLIKVYATHCNVSTEHQILALWLACKFSYSLKNFSTIAYFCHRIEELFPRVTEEGQAVLQNKVSLPTVKRMVAQCAQHEYKDHAPIPSYHPQKLAQVIGQLQQAVSMQQQQGGVAAVNTTASIAHVMCTVSLVAKTTLQEVHQPGAGLVQCSYCGSAADHTHMDKCCVVYGLGSYGGGNAKGVD